MDLLKTAEFRLNRWSVSRRPPDRDDSTLTIEKLTDIYFVPGMQPQLIRPAWTLCRAACPRRPRDRIPVLLLRRISPLLVREGPNVNFGTVCLLDPIG